MDVQNNISMKTEQNLENTYGSSIQSFECILFESTRQQKNRKIKPEIICTSTREEVIMWPGMNAKTFFVKFR